MEDSYESVQALTNFCVNLFMHQALKQTEKQEKRKKEGMCEYMFLGIVSSISAVSGLQSAIVSVPSDLSGQLLTSTPSASRKIRNPQHPEMCSSQNHIFISLQLSCLWSDCYLSNGILCSCRSADDSNQLLVECTQFQGIRGPVRKPCCYGFLIK